MFKNAANLLDLQPAELKAWLQTFDAVISDCDGTLWHDDKAIDGAADVLNALQERAGKRVYLITNNGLKTRHEIWQRSQRLGFHLPSEEHIISPTTTIVDFLKQRQQFTNKHKVYVVGNAAIERELSAAGIASFGAGQAEHLDDKWQNFVQHQFDTSIANSNVGAVVVGWDEYFSYCKLARACLLLTGNADCVLLATNKDAVHKLPYCSIPGTGAFVAAIEACAEVQAIDMGKPNPLAIQPLLKTGCIIAERTLMIGDCCKVDVTFARNCGMQSLLVGTGNFQSEKLRLGNAQRSLPDVYLPKLSDLLPYI